jgi:putative salt-induced outer membrane protein YdiY
MIAHHPSPAGRKLLALLATSLLAYLVLASSALAQSYAENLPSPYAALDIPENLPLELNGPQLEAVPAGPAAAEEIPLAEVPAVSGEVDVSVLVENETPWYYPTHWVEISEWEKAFELGLNGSSGTSETMSLRTGGYIKHKSDARKVDFDLYFNRTQAGGVDTQNNAQLNFRHDWLFGDSPWSIYALTQLYYDRFQAFDLNVNVNSGLGYQWIDREAIKLTTSVGAGASQEIGAPDSDWVPEAQFGFDYEQKLNEMQKLTAGMDYFPEFEDFTRYRLLSEIAWEVLLSQPSNLSLKIAANNRHDSDPFGANPNNLNYSVLLMWKL